MERELKLELPRRSTNAGKDAKGHEGIGRVDSADIAADLTALPVLASCRVEPPHQETLSSTYFDTPDLLLRAHHAALRVRTVGEHRVQTLKMSGTRQAGLYARDEFESVIGTDTPDLDRLRALVPAASEVGALIREDDFAERLQPIFTTDVERTVSLLRLPQGTEIELAVDQGAVHAGGASAPIHEIEMEVKSGEAEHLYGLALNLLDVVPLRLSHRSKSDVGYALVAGEHGEVVRAQPLELGRRDTVEAAFQAIVGNCMAQIGGNERAVVEGHSPESLHQMRVGWRRLRSALDIFASRIVLPQALQAEIEWITGELGPARDWEVLANATLREAFEGAPKDAHGDDIRNAAGDIARDNRQRAADSVNSARYARLMLELTRWAEGAAWREGMDRKHGEAMARPAKAFARATLRARHRKLLKRGRGLAKLDAHRRHRARIAAKKLRYATEFFGSMFPARRSRRFRRLLSSLQDDLGWRNDMVVADQLLERLQGERRAAAVGAGYARGHIAARVAADRDTLRRLWKRFRRVAPPV